MDVFPEAKVILTVRNPDTWYDSVRDTIFMFCQRTKAFPFQVFAWLTGKSRAFRIPGRICHVPADGFKKGEDGDRRMYTVCIPALEHGCSYLL
jgi:hypothetical protein